MAATVITIAVEKGGCGKTVTTSNLAYLMGDEGKKVLCLDTDPQGNLTFALTGGNAITSKAFANRSLYDMIDGFRYNTQTRDFIVESEYENVDLIPANDQTPRLSKRLEDLYTDAQRDYDRGDPKYLASDTDVLDYFLRQVKNEYDYILIDTQPSRDSLLLSNAIAAADYVLIPLKCDSFSEDSAFRTYVLCNEMRKSRTSRIKGVGVMLTWCRKVQPRRTFAVTAGPSSAQRCSTRKSPLARVWITASTAACRSATRPARSPRPKAMWRRMRS